ncbi:hypothetical protein BDR07DRAFT_1485648 [Suillus spraguei]|nr:hypothetical protein BDR07DRAFT_1485648 [Suillus spraguei]
MIFSVTEECPIFAEQTAISNLPHIIIVPNSLINQWYSELHTFSIAEIAFNEFWKGPWTTSTTPMIHHIILVMMILTPPLLILQTSGPILF